MDERNFPWSVEFKDIQNGGFSPAEGGGGDSIYPWVGRCGAAPHTLTLFKPNIADFLTLFKTEFRFLIPYLGHLTQFKTNIDISTP